jgi:membrane protein
MEPAESTTQNRDERGRDAEKVSEIPGRGWKDVAGRVVERFQDEKVVLLSAGVAFFFFLSLIPALAAGISIYALVASPIEIINQAEQFLSGAPSQISGFLTEQLQRISSRAGGTLGWSAAAAILFAVWSASAGTARLIEGVNVAYDENDDRGFFHRRGIAFLWTVGILILAIAGVSVGSSVLDTLRSAEIAPWVRTAGTILFWIGLALVMYVALSITYRYAPYREDPEWRWVSWGSAVAVTLWVIATLGFQLYVSNFGSYDQIYGSLGAVIVFMLWLLITTVIIILGAQINSELEHQTGVDTTVGEPEPMGERGAFVADDIGASHESILSGKQESSGDD